MTVTSRKWLTLPQAADYVGLKTWGLRELVRLRRVKFYRRGKRGNLLFKTDDLDAWIERYAVEPIESD